MFQSKEKQKTQRTARINLPRQVPHYQGPSPEPGLTGHGPEPTVQATVSF